MKKTDRNLLIALIVVLSIVAVALTVFLAFVIHSGGFSGIISLSHKNTVFEQSYSAQEVNRLVLNNIYGDIKINYSDDGDIKIIAKGSSEDNITATADGGVLTVTASSPEKNIVFPFVNTKIPNNDIEIYLPDNCPESLEINSDYGDIDFISQPNTQLVVNSSCGNVEASALYGSFDIHCDFGDIEIGKININKSSSITTDCGDIDVGYTQEIRVEGETSLGSCDIKNNNPDSYIILTVKTDLGDIEINDD